MKGPPVVSSSDRLDEGHEPDDDRADEDGEEPLEVPRCPIRSQAGDHQADRHHRFRDLPFQQPRQGDPDDQHDDADGDEQDRGQGGEPASMPLRFVDPEEDDGGEAEDADEIQPGQDDQQFPGRRERGRPKRPAEAHTVRWLPRPITARSWPLPFSWRPATDSHVRIENSFIPVRGVGEHTERELWRRGITHWDDFERDAVGPKTGARVEAFIESGRTALGANDADFFADVLPSRSRWRMFENFRTETAYLDIETTGLSRRRDEVTVVTVHRDGGTTTLVRGRDLTRRRLRDLLADAGLLVTYNGKRFDVPFLERAFDLQLDGPHLDLLYPCRRLDLTGGLKTVERHLDIDRADRDLSGRDAVRLWRAYERGDQSALDTLVRYNRDDTRNLEAVTEAVCRRLEARIFAPVTEAPNDGRTDTVSLSRF